MRRDTFRHIFAISLLLRFDSEQIISSHVNQGNILKLHEYIRIYIKTNSEFAH